MAKSTIKHGDKPAGKGKKLKLQQIASSARREHSQTETLIGLGLNKLHRTRELEDTAAVRGMIIKVRHMVRIIEG